MKITANKVGMTILVILALCVFLPATAQRTGSRPTQGSPEGDPQYEQQKAKKQIKKGNAWTLETPLGLHEASTIDTLLYNYQQQFIPSMVSDAYATTGQMGGPGLNMLYFERKQPLPYLFANSIRHWIPSFDKIKFYNVYGPMTLLSYNFSYGREDRADLLRAVFAGNVNRKIGVGAFIDYPYTKGCYTDQAAKGLDYGFTFYYKGDRYQAQAFYYNLMNLNKENGGITNDLYVTNPAEVQGGVNEIEPKSIPVRLSGVHNMVRGQQFFMTHSYNIGFSRDVTQPKDTVPKYEFIPVTRFIYSFDFRGDSRKFLVKHSDKSRAFWKDTYFNLNETDERSEHWSIANTGGIEMVEGFQKWFPFGLSAWATYEIGKYWFDMLLPKVAEDGNMNQDNTGLTPLPEGIDPDTRSTVHRVWVGGRLAKTRGRTINYYAEGKFGIVGDVAGDIEAKGSFTTRFRLGKDTVMLNAEGQFLNKAPDWLLQHYIGNYFVWNNNFGKTRSFRVGGKLHIPWTNTDLGVNFENLQNYIYFNSSSLPEQYGGNIQIFSAFLDQKLKLGIWNWNNRITYQTSSDKTRLPLPVLTIYSNMFLGFKLVKVLDVQIGVDCDYYTLYPGMAYQPATMSFHVQGENPIYIGNYANCNAYLTCKLQKVRFFVLCSHVNQGLFGRNYFAAPHYPINARQFRFGLSIDFAN